MTSDIFELTRLLGKDQFSLKLPHVPKTIVDAGANSGYSALRFHKEFPDAKIIAIEPEPRNAVLLRENCKPYSNIEIEEAALWYRKCSLSIKSLDVGMNAFQVVEDDRGPICATSIDAIMDKYALPEIDLLKIDIEGGEKDLFAQGCQWLSKVRMILIEIHEGCGEIVMDAMAGFERGPPQDEYDFFYRN